MTVKKRGGKPNRKRRRGVFLLIGGVTVAAAMVLGLSLWFAGPQGVRQAYAVAPESALPDKVRKAPPNVREAYRFAIANRRRSDISRATVAVEPSTRAITSATSRRCGPTAAICSTT